jgi:hypothetical protein
MTHNQHSHTPEERAPVAADETADFRVQTEDAEPGLSVLDDEAPPPDAADVLPEPGPVPSAERVVNRPEPWGLAPDRHLSIPNYRYLSVTEVIAKARSLSPEQLHEICKFEVKHRNRKTLLAQLDRILTGRQRAKKS